MEQTLMFFVLNWFHRKIREKVRYESTFMLKISIANGIRNVLFLKQINFVFINLTNNINRL